MADMSLAPVSVVSIITSVQNKVDGLDNRKPCFDDAKRTPSQVDGLDYRKSCFDAKKTPLAVVGKEPGKLVKRSRGRSAGSKNKPKLPIIVTRDSPNVLRAHAMEVSSGCDVSESIVTFAWRKQRGMCILSGTGCAMNVTLRQPSSPGVIVTLHGRFEILSLVGSILPPPAPPGMTDLIIYLAGGQGQVVGGGVVGALIAAGPVVIMAASFMSATFDRLPLGDDDDAAAAAATATATAHSQYIQSNHHHFHPVDMYGGIRCIPPNLLTNGGLPHEVLLDVRPAHLLSKR